MKWRRYISKIQISVTFEWTLGAFWEPRSEHFASSRMVKVNIKRSWHFFRQLLLPMCCFVSFIFWIFQQIGLPGGGGEYEVQEGFGWSNGVLLHFLNNYNDLISPEISGIAPIPKMSIFLVPIVLLILTIWVLKI